MRKYLLLLSVFSLFLFVARAQKTAALKFKLPKNISNKDYLPNTIVLKFKSLSEKQGGQLLTAVNKSLALNGIATASLKPLFPAGKKSLGNETQALAPGLDVSQIYELKYLGQEKVETVINAVLVNEEVVYAEPSYIYKTSYTPNDPYYNIQSSLTKVKTPEAWDIIRNASGVTIAIVDSGSDLQHEDLAGNIKLNTADPINGVDDDGDGYIDNYYGWDLIGLSASSMIPDNNPDVTSDTTDHGVHVSGIAGAVSDNGTGVASIAYNAKLLIVKVGADDDARSIYKGYEGIKYAADHGASIINCSWGGAGGGQYGQDIIDYAISKGCLVVAAAGNDGAPDAIYPAAYKGVLGVASVEQNDRKASYSNYYTQIGIAAIGSGIYNTINNGYGVKSGTSMAAPQVSSAAALVKAKYPQYSGLQIGELLKRTADPIDNLNASVYVGKLGKGRLNVLRAVTESPVAVKYDKFVVSDQTNGSRAAGTDLTINLDLKNYLSAVNGLQVTLSTTSAFAQVINANASVGNLATLQTATGVGPFTVRIASNTPENQTVLFKLSYVGNNGTYTDTEYFEINVALDYLDVVVNQVATTFSSNGRVGFSRNDAIGGLGFLYKEEPLLYEASLMIASGSDQVANNARIGAGDSSEDFIKKTSAKLVADPTALFAGESVFTDAGKLRPTGLNITSKMLAYGAPDDKYVIVSYDIVNTSGKDLPAVYPGLFTDWDLNESSHNATAYDEALRLGYVYDRKTANFPYGGVKLLSANALPAYYPMSYQVPNSFLADDNFTEEEKYRSLSSGVAATSLGENNADGNDVMFAIGAGPYRISAGEKITVSFAFLAGDDLADLKEQAILAQQKYQSLGTGDATPLVPELTKLYQNYPNPGLVNTNLPFDLSERSDVTLTVSDMQGKIKEVLLSDKTLDAGTYNLPLDLSGYGTGVYIYQLKTAKYKKAFKFVVKK